jgi:hypothetical protein
VAGAPWCVRVIRVAFALVSQVSPLLTFIAVATSEITDTYVYHRKCSYLVFWGWPRLMTFTSIPKITFAYSSPP